MRVCVCVYVCVLSLIRLWQDCLVTVCVCVCVCVSFIWYHGALTRSEAESLLTLCKECSYLVRNSQTSRTEYSLSLR